LGKSKVNVGSMNVSSSDPDSGPATPSAHPSRALSIRLQIGGFFVIAALLGLDAYVGIRGAISVREGLAQVGTDEVTDSSLINSTLRAQRALDSIRRRMADQKYAMSREQSIAEVQRINESLRNTFSTTPRQIDRGLWQQTQTAAYALTTAMGNALESSSGTSLDLQRLDQAYEDFAAATTGLVQSSQSWSDAVRRQIEQSTGRQSVEDRLLLSGCLVIACLFLWTAVRTHRLLKEQAEELNRVSWQLLEKQETLARRLSRELHDELGQSLTALKTNFSRHASSPCVDSSWMADCTKLLTDSMRSAHEISQLLRPTVLDDFGLDSALAWLCERFEERNGVKVFYLADFHDRLKPQTETHVFRIAQEALTNVARHASATRVNVNFKKNGDLLSLEVSDNGAGIPARSQPGRESFGLTGMKARARSLLGSMEVVSAPQAGTSIRVTFPLRASGDEEDQNTAG
jgi:signal transduction histidine kinase